MNKSQFINSLDQRLQHVNFEERSNIISYYIELIDDQKEMGKSEEEIIAKLNIDQIIADLNMPNNQANYQQNQANSHQGGQGANPFKNANQGEPKHYQTSYRDGQNGNSSSYPNDNLPKNEPIMTRRSWIILITILTFPIWIGLVCGAFGILVGLLSALIAIIASGFACLIGGVVTLVLIPFTEGLTTEIIMMQAGGAIALIGLGLMMIPPTILLFKYLPKGFKALVNWIQGLIKGVKNA